MNIRRQNSNRCLYVRGKSRGRHAARDLAFRFTRYWLQISSCAGMAVKDGRKRPGDPRIHDAAQRENFFRPARGHSSWIAGTSPAMTTNITVAQCAAPLRGRALRVLHADWKLCRTRRRWAAARASARPARGDDADDGRGADDVCDGARSAIGDAGGHDGAGRARNCARCENARFASGVRAHSPTRRDVPAPIRAAASDGRACSSARWRQAAWMSR